jgi:hypothetical protein
MRASLKIFLVGSALALAALPAPSAEETSHVAAESAPTAVIRCPGVTSVPFTSDAEQALPLRVVGLLACGERVAVLSENEGYTAQIRRSDGLEGYVAVIYLGSDRSAAATPQPLLYSAQPVNGVIRWAAGGAGCDEFLSHGRHVESITANGVTVQVSLQDTGWKYRANVAVSNQSTKSVEVVSGIMTLDELMPNLRSLPTVSPEKLAHAPTHQAFWTLADAVPSRSAVANYSANLPENDRLANRTSPAPDYLNRHMTPASTRHAAFQSDETLDIQSVTLRSGSVASGQINSGVMWFERDVNAHELSFRAPVGDMVFDFAFSLEGKK